MRFPPESGRGVTEIPIWVNRKRTKFLVKFKERLENYYKRSSDSLRGLIQRERLGESLDEQKRLAQSYTFLAAGPDFGPYITDLNTGERVELFLEITQLQRYAGALDIVRARLDKAINIYRADRTAALKRTFDPAKMAKWAYNSMGQMPEEHLQYWLRQGAIKIYTFSKNLFAVIGVIVVLNDFVFQLFGIPPFFGYHDTLVHAAHRLGHWLRCHWH